MPLPQIRQRLQEQARKVRALVYLTDSANFERLFEAATPNQQAIAETLILIEDIAGLKKWAALQTGNITKTELMAMAQRHGIPGWSRMSKEELVEFFEQSLLPKATRTAQGPNLTVSSGNDPTVRGSS